MRLSQQTRRAYLVMLACVVGAGALTYVLGTYMLDLLYGTAVFACYVCFAFIWLRLMEGRFLHPTALACVRITGALMVGWLFVRTVKYEFSDGFPELQRHLWYSYYVFYSLIPAFLLIVVMHAGTRVDERIARRWWLLPVVAIAIAVLFLTNDLHQLVFRFAGEDYGCGETGTYRHGPLYLVSWTWTTLLAGSAVVLSVLRSVHLLPAAAYARPRASWRWMVLLVPLGLGVAYSLGSVFAPNSFIMYICKFPETTCVLIVVYMELLVQLGLFPANEGYQELWHASTLRGGLMDERGNVAFASSGMPEVSEEQVRAALAGSVSLGGDIELMARKVHGGMAFWLRDLSHVRHLQAELEELGDVLAEENAMLAAEAELDHEREALAQRARLQGEVMAYVAPELAELRALLDEVEATDDERALLAFMRRAAVLASYIKRAANLMLVGESGAVDARELSLACAETAEWLDLSCSSERSEGFCASRHPESEASRHPESLLLRPESEPSCHPEQSERSERSRRTSSAPRQMMAPSTSSTLSTREALARYRAFVFGSGTTPTPNTTLSPTPTPNPNPTPNPAECGDAA